MYPKLRIRISVLFYVRKQLHLDNCIPLSCGSDYPGKYRQDPPATAASVPRIRRRGNKKQKNSTRKENAYEKDNE